VRGLCRDSTSDPPRLPSVHPSPNEPNAFSSTYSTSKSSRRTLSSAFTACIELPGRGAVTLPLLRSSGLVPGGLGLHQLLHSALKTVRLKNAS
jgi:hypothetical protein